jgi:hypothetical protein
MKSWYSARLLFEAEVEGEEDPLCEESIRLVEADNDDDAQQRAAEIGAQGQHEYLNGEGQTVRWHFRGVLEIQELCETKITHGVEVFSRMFRKSQFRHWN